MDSDTDWLRTDELTEGVKGLRQARELLAAGLVDAYELKWAALAVVTSLQGFIVAVHSSMEVLSWDSKAMKQFEAWQAGEAESVVPTGDVRLPSFRPLCEKVKQRGWQPDDDTWDHLMRLNEIRDTFMHYTSGGLSAEARWIREACAAGLAAIRFLVEDATSNVWPDDETEQMVCRELDVAERLVQLGLSGT